MSELVDRAPRRTGADGDPTGGPPEAAAGFAGAYGREQRALAVAHRGGAGTAAENTLEAFQGAVALGYTYLETDIRVTADDVCVAFHDRSLRRLTGVPGLLSSTAWRQVQELVVLGSGRVPRLEDLLTAFPHARWLIDVKQAAALPVLLDVIRRHGATERICLAGTWDAYLARARFELGPRLATSVGWQQLARLLAGGRQAPRGARFAHVPLRLGRAHLPTPRLVERVHACGLRLLVWDVDDAVTAHELLTRGVDGVITDRPDAVRAAVAAHGALDAIDA